MNELAHHSRRHISFLLGLLMLGPGLWTSIEAIKADYAGGASPAFSCKSNAL